ncbi:MAG: metal-binding protein [Armatimonadaceae bacterium]
MPSGKVHDQITIVGAALAAPAWWLLTPPPHDWTVGATLIGATLFSGLMLSPDLDLNSSIYRRWGPLRFLWWPYQKLIPHRSHLSHSLVLGPALRIAYFLFVCWVLFRVVTWGLSHFISFDRNALSEHYAGTVLGLYQLYPQHTIMAAVGIFVGGFLHVGADMVGSAMRRKRR